MDRKIRELVVKRSIRTNVDFLSGRISGIVGVILGENVKLAYDIINHGRYECHVIFATDEEWTLIKKHLFLTDYVKELISIRTE